MTTNQKPSSRSFDEWLESHSAQLRQSRKSAPTREGGAAAVSRIAADRTGADGRRHFRGR